MDSGFPVLDSASQSLAGFMIPCAEFPIPKTRIPDFKRKENSRTPGQNPDYFTCGNKPLHTVEPVLTLYTLRSKSEFSFVAPIHFPQK